MLTVLSINKTTTPWSCAEEPGAIGYSDASGREGQSGWTWGAVVHLPGRDDALLASGYCPDWVTEATTAEIWGMGEAGRLIVAHSPMARTPAALVCDCSWAVYAAVAVLRGAVPACKDPIRSIAADVLRMVRHGEGEGDAFGRAKACHSILDLGYPTLLRAERTVAEIEIADELARHHGGLSPRRDSTVQRSTELRHFVFRT